VTELRNRIASHTARVGVVGLGYVGLPLAVEFAEAGFSVTGIDIDARKVADLNRGESYIQDVPPALLRRLSNPASCARPPISALWPPRHH
jgi:UDP-N-acetyl-D-glucosamine dehydrogenase